MQTAEGPVFEEIEIMDSEDWCRKGADGIAKKVHGLVQAHPTMTEFTIRAGRNWKLKRLVPYKNLFTGIGAEPKATSTDASLG